MCATLDEALRRINAARKSGDASEERVDGLYGGPSQRLAVYGTLAPGEVNHHELESVRGTWRTGWVEGHLHAEGWGATDGFPAMVWEPGAPRVPVRVLESAQLAQHWDRLDAFEGAEYLRVLVPVHGLATAAVVANLYSLRERVPGRAS